MAAKNQEACFEDLLSILIAENVLDWPARAGKSDYEVRRLRRLLHALGKSHYHGTPIPADVYHFWKTGCLPPE